MCNTTLLRGLELWSQKGHARTKHLESTLLVVWSSAPKKHARGNESFSFAAEAAREGEGGWVTQERGKRLGQL
jgi:hypothetical protein